MGLAWRSTPVGKMNANLPFFKQMALKEFTQKFDITSKISKIKYVYHSPILTIVKEL
jgi:hypothetical protein